MSLEAGNMEYTDDLERYGFKAVSESISWLEWVWETRRKRDETILSTIFAEKYGRKEM